MLTTKKPTLVSSYPLSLLYNVNNFSEEFVKVRRGPEHTTNLLEVKGMMLTSIAGKITGREPYNGY